MHNITRVSSRLTRVCLLIVVASFAGCANYPQSRAILADVPRDLPPRVFNKHIPFVAQEDYFCGPSALSMMLQAQGLDPPMQTLVDMVYVPERQGSFQIELITATRRFDLIPYVIEPKLEHVFRELAAGHPVLFMQNLGLPSRPTWHYAVAIGYDLAAKEVIIHSGLEAEKRIAIGTFERTWINFAQGWAMVALPPENIPAMATPLRYQKSIENMVVIERSGPALRAYKTALDHWPNDAAIPFGLANLQYQLGDYQASVESFLTSIERAPSNASTWNNLSYALAQSGCKSAELAYACALELDAGNTFFSTTPQDVQQLLARESLNTETCPDLPQCPSAQLEY